MDCSFRSMYCTIVLPISLPFLCHISPCHSLYHSPSLSDWSIKLVIRRATRLLGLILHCPYSSVSSFFNFHPFSMVPSSSIVLADAASVHSLMSPLLALPSPGCFQSHMDHVYFNTSLPFFDANKLIILLIHFLLPSLVLPLHPIYPLLHLFLLTSFLFLNDDPLLLTST